MSDYYGPERRKIDRDLASTIARIDERTRIISENMEKLASIESVRSVEGKIDSHITTHVKSNSLVVAWIGIISSAILGAIGAFKGLK